MIARRQAQRVSPIPTHFVRCAAHGRLAFHPTVEIVDLSNLSDPQIAREFALRCGVIGSARGLVSLRHAGGNK